MKKQLLFILSVFLLINTYGQQVEIYQDTIPFRNDLGLIIIPIHFNGELKEFAFDTGAEYSVAYSWAKEQLKRTNKSITINSSSGLKSRMRFYKSGKIELGSRKISGHRILNAPKNAIFSCHNIDGILGVDIIKEFNWTIDYQHQRLIMYPANHFPRKVQKMHPLDFDFRKQRPYVFLQLKSHKIQFLLDTGASGSSNISRRTYNLTNLEKYPKTTFHSGSFDVNGILSSSQPVVFQLPPSSSKEVSLSPVIYYNNQKSTKIGNRLWAGQELFLSLKRDQLFLSSSNIQETYESYTCSVLFFKGKMRIMRIEEGSDLWKMGIRQGDEVLRYNGKKFTDFCSLDQFHRKVIASGKPFELELASGKFVTVSKKSSLR